MKLRQWFEEWGLKGLKVSVGVMEMEWAPQTEDQDAAWDMYVELLTRISTQPLSDEHGVEKTALASIYKLFDITRNVLHQHGRNCDGFARIAIIVLNQVVRPFTAEWHRLSENGAFENPDQCNSFRMELKVLQERLVSYTQLLAAIAGVEDMTGLVEEDLKKGV